MKVAAVESVSDVFLGGFRGSSGAHLLDDDYTVLGLRLRLRTNCCESDSKTDGLDWYAGLDCRVLAVDLVVDLVVVLVYGSE